MLDRLLAAIGIHRHQTRLQFVSGPTRVRLRGEVASDNSIESSATGTTAAWMRYVLGTIVSYYDSERGETVEIVKEVAAAEVPADLVMRTEDGLVLIPARCFRVKAAGDALSARLPLSGNPPKELHGAIQASNTGGLLYGEQYLRKGDAIELRAHVAPSGQVDVPWKVVPTEEALVIDRSLEELGL